MAKRQNHPLTESNVVPFAVNQQVDSPLAWQGNMTVEHQIWTAVMCVCIIGGGILLSMSTIGANRCSDLVRGLDTPGRLIAAGCGAEAKQVMLERAGFADSANSTFKSAR